MGLIPAAILFVLAVWQMHQSGGGRDAHGMAGMILLLLAVAALGLAPFIPWRVRAWVQRSLRRKGDRAR